MSIHVAGGGGQPGSSSRRGGPFLFLETLIFLTPESKSQGSLFSTFFFFFQNSFSYSTIFGFPSKFLHMIMHIIILKNTIGS